MTKLFITTLLLCGGFFSPAVAQTRSIYDFKVAGLDGDTIDFINSKAKDPHRKHRQQSAVSPAIRRPGGKLYETYKDKLVIVGFPANNFFSQNPAAAKQSASSAKNYGVSFPMAAKISVKGRTSHPLQMAMQYEENGVMDAKISWNFNKFLLDENGKIIAHFKSAVKPMSEIVSRL